MPKVRKLLDSNNVMNPLSLRSSMKTEDDAANRKRKGKVIEEVTLSSTAEDSQDNLEAAEAVTVVKDEPNFNLYAGTDLGLLKGISIGNDLPIAKSIFKPENIKTKPPGVSSLTWVDDTEKELLVCLSNHIVKTYNTKLRCFSRQVELDMDPMFQNKEVVGLCCYNSVNYVIGLDNGKVAMYNILDSEITMSFDTFKDKGDSLQDLRKVRQCPSDKKIFATGGKENDLQIWDIESEKPDIPIFKAKNVPHDFLDLRLPVWVQDLTFLPRTSELVAVGTRYGQIRLYDVRVPRPVSNVQFADHPIMSIAATMDDRQVVVGTAKGEAGIFDLRNPGHEKLCLKFHGSCGSIRSMVACPDQPYVVSSGLDRHLYIHKFGTRAPVKKLYLNQQINCVALSKTFMKEMKIGAVEPEAATADDWANIPPEVLNVTVTAPEVMAPVSPTKKLRKTVRS